MIGGEDAGSPKFTAILCQRAMPSNPGEAYTQTTLLLLAELCVDVGFLGVKIVTPRIEFFEAKSA